MTLFAWIYAVIIVLFWLGAIYFMIRLLFLTKPEVDIWRGKFFNPFNRVFMSANLTEKGLIARRNHFICLIAFVILCILPLLIY